MKKSLKFIHCMYIALLGMLLCTTLIGLLYKTNGNSYEYVNQYGDIVKIWGNGLYANDSYFKAPILRGTDLTFLVFVAPLLVIFLIINIKKNNQLSKYMLCSVNAALLYYSACLAFSVAYNFLHLLYIAFFALSLFSFIVSLLQAIPNTDNLSIKLPYKSIYAFLLVSGISLFVAWLPDIISALIQNRPIALIENYTTEVTYVLDIGVISPLCILTLYLLYKRKNISYPLITMIFTVCSVVGIMVCLQTVFQLSAGIDLPVAALITKVGIFVILAIFSISFLLISLRRFCKVSKESVCLDKTL